MADVVKTKKELRAELVAALRSGKYTQGHGYLSYRSCENGPAKMCCLGVACQLIREPDRKSYPMGVGHYIDLWRGGMAGDMVGSTGIVLTSDIQKLYGFATSNGFFIVTTELLKKFPTLDKCISTNAKGQRTSSLTHLNDTLGWTFKEIADLIEAEPEGMFVD